MLRVLHIACHESNIGDGALVGALQAGLRSVRSDVAFTAVDIMRSRHWWGRLDFDSAFFRLAQRDFDLVLVGGGGLINSSPRETRSGFSFDASPSTLRSCAIPVVFYALGVNLFRGERLARPKRLADFLEAVRSRPDRFLFSLRDDGSLARLERELGHPVPTPVVPDPGLFVRPVPTAFPQLRPGETNVLVQLAGDRPELRYGDRREELARLGRALARLVRERDANIVLVPHLPWDLALLAELLEVSPGELSRFHCETLGVMRGVDRAPHFFDAYRQASLVIGMRGHAAICAVGLEVPFIGLITHDKVDGFLEGCGLARFGVEMSDPDLESRLDALTTELLDHPDRYRTLARAARRDAEARAATLHRDVSALVPPA